MGSHLFMVSWSIGYVVQYPLFLCLGLIWMMKCLIVWDKDPGLPLDILYSLLDALFNNDLPRKIHILNLVIFSLTQNKPFLLVVQRYSYFLASKMGTKCYIFSFCFLLDLWKNNIDATQLIIAENRKEGTFRVLWWNSMEEHKNRKLKITNR